MLELYHYEPYANSMKCLVCLEEKGLAFQSRYVDILRFEQHAAAFVKINPNGQVPVLIHDGKTIVEFSVINEYLDDVFPELCCGRPIRQRAPACGCGASGLRHPRSSVSMIGWQLRFRPLAQGIGKAEFAERMKRVPLKEIREKWEITAGPGFTRRNSRSCDARSAGSSSEWRKHWVTVPGSPAGTIRSPISTLIR